VTLSDDVEDVLDQLPDDRDLLPDEARAVAVALDADAVSRLTYSDDSETVAVWATLLWWSESGAVGWLSTRDGAEIEVLATDASHAEFLDAVDSAIERFGVERGGGEVLKLDDDGEVVDRFERDL